MFGQKGDEGARGFPGPPGPIGLQVSPIVSNTFSDMIRLVSHCELSPMVTQINTAQAICRLPRAVDELGGVSDVN